MFMYVPNVYIYLQCGYMSLMCEKSLTCICVSNVYICHLYIHICLLCLHVSNVYICLPYVYMSLLCIYVPSVHICL